MLLKSFQFWFFCVTKYQEVKSYSAPPVVYYLVNTWISPEYVAWLVCTCESIADVRQRQGDPGSDCHPRHTMAQRSLRARILLLHSVSRLGRRCVCVCVLCETVVLSYDCLFPRPPNLTTCAVTFLGSTFLGVVEIIFEHSYQHSIRCKAPRFHSD